MSAAIIDGLSLSMARYGPHPSVGGSACYRSSTHTTVLTGQHQYDLAISPDPMSLVCPFMSLICPLCPHLCPEKIPRRDPRFSGEGRGKIGQGRAVKNVIWGGTKCHFRGSGEGQSGFSGGPRVWCGDTPLQSESNCQGCHYGLRCIYLLH